MAGRTPKTGGRAQEEAAALAALGFLTPSEAENVAPGAVAEMTEALALLPAAVPPAPPAAGLKDRLLGRVAEWESLHPLADLRTYDCIWKSAGAPGVDMRSLFRDRQTGRTTMLIRMEPGAHFPAHHHADDEQCYVLKGDVRCGDVVYEEGDFVVMAKNTVHPGIRSVNGNLMLLIAGRNEFVEA